MALAREGARVAVVDILEDGAAAVCREIEALGGAALALAADVTRRPEVTRAVADTIARWGQLDIVVNNAGWDRLEPFLESEEETWERILAINFKSVPTSRAHGTGARRMPGPTSRRRRFRRHMAGSEHPTRGRQRRELCYHLRSSTFPGEGWEEDVPCR
jgi:NAD(P)-dependent dehydrogenase (short-subunit alcohol dehydrogenase family)